MDSVDIVHGLSGQSPGSSGRLDNIHFSWTQWTLSSPVILDFAHCISGHLSTLSFQYSMSMDNVHWVHGLFTDGKPAQEAEHNNKL